jgi:hypothetical protein
MKRARDTLTLKGYADAGGMAPSSIQQECLSESFTDEQTIARNIFLRGEECWMEDTRRRSPLKN